MSYFHLGREWDEQPTPAELEATVAEITAQVRAVFDVGLSEFFAKPIEDDGFVTLYPSL